jgi:hypothetical protein
LYIKFQPQKKQMKIVNYLICYCASVYSTYCSAVIFGMQLFTWIAYSLEHNIEDVIEVKFTFKWYFQKIPLILQWKCNVYY